MGLIASKSPAGGISCSDDDSSLGSARRRRASRRRRRRRKLPPTPSPWTSTAGELADSSTDHESSAIVRILPRSAITGQPHSHATRVDSSSEDEADSTSAPPRRGKWIASGPRRSMLRKLLGRLSQKVNPHGQDSSANVVAPPVGRQHDIGGTAAFTSTAVRVGVTSTVNQRACRHHGDGSRLSLSIRSSLQSCAAHVTSDCTNNNCHKPAAQNNVSRICAFNIKLQWPTVVAIENCKMPLS